MFTKVVVAVVVVVAAVGEVGIGCEHL